MWSFQTRPFRPCLLPSGGNTYFQVSVGIIEEAPPSVGCDQINPDKTPRLLRARHPGDTRRIMRSLNGRDIGGGKISVSLDASPSDAFLGELARTHAKPF